MGRRFLSGFLLFCAATIGTDSDDPEQMLRDFELMLRCHCVLNRFEFSREEFDDLSATGADHMVMVLMLVVMLVMRAAVTEADFSGETGIRQKFQRSIDGGLADIRIQFAHQAIEIFARDVTLCAEKYFQDQVALRGSGADLSGAYHRRLTRVYQSLVHAGQRVLEIGCGTGDLALFLAGRGCQVAAAAGLSPVC